MDNNPKIKSGKLVNKLAGWAITVLFALGLWVGFAGIVSKTSAAVEAQAPVPTMAPMPGMPGMNPTPAAMPGMAMPNTVQGNSPTVNDGSIDALIQKMQAMMQSLQGMMGQLDQKNSMINAAPAAAPTTAPSIDMQAMMAEIQSINQAMGPLMMRIQADLQGNPSAEELASVRAQVEQVYTRVAKLVTQLQAAQGMTQPAPAATPTMVPMPGMGQLPAAGSPQDQEMMAKLNEMMQKVQFMLQQMQSQQAQPGGMPSQTGTMPGMSNMPMQNSSMQGTSPSDPAMGGMMMDDMMMMMDNMMKMMDSMMMDMDMMGGMPDM